MPAPYRKLIVAIALCGIFTLGIWPAFHSPAIPMDEGMVLVYPEMILKEQLPYRDFESITGPGNSMILAGAYAGFGPNLFVERAVGLAYRIFIVLAIFGIAQRWGALIATSCAILTIVLLAGTDLWANTWYTGLSFALCSLWAMADARSSWRCFVAGLLAGIALLGRCDFGPALIASSLPLFLSMERSAKLRFIAGIVLALSPLIWITLMIGPMPIFHSLFVFPVFKLNPGRHLAISAAGWQMQCLLFLQIGASIMNISAGIVEFRDRASRQRGRLLLGVGLLGIGLIPYAAEDADKLLTELERASIPGQRLFVGPGDLRLTNYCDTYIYYLEPQLRPATYFLEMNPGSANAPHSRLASDIAGADWVILNRRWDFLNELNRSTTFGSDEPNQIVRENFELWWQRGAYLLFRNKRISNAIVPPPP